MRRLVERSCLACGERLFRLAQVFLRVLGEDGDEFPHELVITGGLTEGFGIERNACGRLWLGPGAAMLVPVRAAGEGRFPATGA
jgi:hypothetical protein